MSAKMDALGKQGHKDIRTPTEEYNGEPSSQSKEQSNILRKPTLICPVTFQEVPNNKGSRKANWTPVTMLDLEKLKKAVVVLL